MGSLHHLSPSAARSNATRLIYLLWATLGALCFFQFDRGGSSDSISNFSMKYEFCHNRGIVRHLLSCCPMLSATHSNAMNLMVSSWAMMGVLGFERCHWCCEILINFQCGEKYVLPTEQELIPEY